MKVIAVYSLKGGVGKTTSCVNLAYCSAQEERVSLLWDLDPQGAATFFFQLKPKVIGGLKRMFDKQSHLSHHAQSTAFSTLDVIPSDISYRHMDLMLENMAQSKKRLGKMLKELETEYEFVFIDCPPTITLLAEHIFEVADVVLFPIVPTTLAERAYLQIKKYFKKKGYLESKLFPFLSMVDNRKTLHRETATRFRLEHFETLNTVIPNSAIIERMGPAQSPVLTFSAQSKPALSYQLLWKEVKNLPIMH